MSSTSEPDETMCCASCGVAEVNEIKLKKCDACKFVRYCGVKCQRDHWPKHKKACKKRAAELRDEVLFKQPESSHLGDCPICCLPLLIDTKQSFHACCSKVICAGCDYANQMREIQGSLDPKCPFCRHPVSKSLEESIQKMKKRIEANDPVAMSRIGSLRFREGDYNTAFEYWTKAAELGDVGAHYELSCLYRDGRGVEKDKKKQWHHLEEAAIDGDPGARNNLGCVEWKNGRTDRAIKHWIIAANLGYHDSLDALKKNFRMGLLSKEDFAKALRGYQATVDATKSSQRDEAEAALQE
jgi:hypothetical protein